MKFSDCCKNLILYFSSRKKFQINVYKCTQTMVFDKIQLHVNSVIYVTKKQNLVIELHFPFY